jgi:asparagine synthase (glutamine-hydrolysing)
MSALAGLWNFDGRPDADDSVARMLASQGMYGPHDSERWNAGAVALGRNLYRTLPEDKYDLQPLTGGNGRFALVADVRIDHREDLISALGIATPTARETADSALLLAAWERWQEQAFDRLEGDYAFALLDRAEKRLILARDLAGHRPLYYHRGDNFFAFASMPKGLHALPAIPRLPDEERVIEELALLPEGGTQTFFKGIERVETGCYLVVTPSGISTNRHWNPSRKTLKLSSAAEYAEGLRHHLDDAARVRLRGADGLVGAHLSSGFDSSAVATSAAMEMQKTGGKVLAFTAVPREGFKGPTQRLRHPDEGPVAALTAARYPNMEHVLVRSTGRSPFDNLDSFVTLFERPMLNLCNGVWITALNDMAKARGVRVMFTGQMGNMTISYDGLTLLPYLVRRGRWLKWAREGVGLVRTRHQRIRNVMAMSFGPYLPLPIWDWINRTFRGVASDMTSYSAINPAAIAAMDIEGKARARGLDLHYRPRKDAFETRLWVIRRVDTANYAKGMLAGWGIDQRDPTVDRRLLEFCLSVPEEQFLVDGQPKALARRAFAGRLPPEVINMRGKGLQAADWYENLAAARSAAADEVARLEDHAASAHAIDLPRLKALLADWPEGGWNQEAVIRSYRLALLRGISSGHFLRRASGSNT